MLVVPPEREAPPPEIQVPFIEKHPPKRLIPFDAVDVAVVPVRFRYVPCRPAANVEVAVVEVAV